MNDKIRVREVRLVDPDGTQLGIKTLPEALQIARDLDLDLVEVAPLANPPEASTTAPVGCDTEPVAFATSIAWIRPALVRAPTARTPSTMRVPASRSCCASASKRRMPGMDGTTLARTIRLDPVLEKTPLIMIGASKRSEPFATPSQGDLDHWLSKPIKPSHLHATLCTMLASDPAAPQNHCGETGPSAGRRG